jgi:hypothetical protein
VGSGVRAYCGPEVDCQRRLSRYVQIAADVAWRKLSAWFSLDDDFKEWSGDQSQRDG